MLPQDQIDARLARYNLTRDARDLWPEVPVSAFRTAQEEIARVTAAVLADAPSPVQLRLPPDVTVRALGVAASAAGMGPLLGWWCETGRVAAQAPVADLLAAHLEHGRRRAARLRREFECILGGLFDRGIDVWALKGTHTGYRYFPEPGTRPVTDIDLLVRPEDGPAARGVLRDLGFAQSGPAELHRSTWAAPGVSLVRSLELTHADDPWSVDLHVSLDRQQFVGVTSALGSPDAWAGDVWHEFSRPIHVLPQPLLLAYLALHTSSHFYGMRLVLLVEIAWVARSDFAGRPELWQVFDELVLRQNAGQFVFPALDLVERLVPGTIAPLVLEHLATAAPRRLRRLVRGTTPATAQRLHPYPFGERYVWAAMPTQVLASVLDVLWPREGEQLMSPPKVIARQWLRIRRALRRLVPARLRR